MLARLVGRALAYLVIGAFVSLVWVVLTDGTAADLRAYAAEPDTALTTDFWPVLYWLVGGMVVALTAVRTLSRILRPATWSGQLRRTRELEAEGIPRAEAMLTAAEEQDIRRHRRRRPWDRGDHYLAVMFTDICGSTELNERLGDATWAKVVDDHRALVRDATRHHDGHEVNTQGDGFFVRFDEPGRAVACAVDIQRRLAQRRLATDAAVPAVRIGVHSGLAIHGDDDVLGQVVNIGARLMDVAGPDDILVTEPVIDRSNKALTVEDRGLVPLKGLAHPRHVLAVAWRE